MKGDVYVFRAETDPPGDLKKAMKITADMLRERDGSLPLNDPYVFDEFFRRFYHIQTPDPCGVQASRANLDFATVERKVRLIDDKGQQPVVVPWGEEARRRIAAFQSDPGRETLRALQPYMVQVYADQFAPLVSEPAVEYLHEQVYVLTELYAELYDERFGLLVGDDPQADPEVLHV